MNVEQQKQSNLSPLRRAIAFHLKEYSQKGFICGNDTKQHWNRNYSAGYELLCAQLITINYEVFEFAHI